MSHYPDFCIHDPNGLCEECFADAEADPDAWAEYGNHPEGLRRWQELLAEIEESAKQRESSPAIAGEDIPF